MIFAVERLADCWEEWLSVAASHWDGEFNPDADRYKKNCELGWFILCVGRSEGMMACYCGLYITPSMHTKKLVASEDFVYIAPEYRRGRNASLFYRFCEKEAIKRGATEVHLKVKPESVAQRYLVAMDYKITKIQYSKTFDTNPMT